MAVLKLSQIVSSPSNLVAADTLVGVHGGNTDYQFTGTQVSAFINANLPAYPAGANPSVTVGLTAKNGSAATFMTSDSAPALDQTAAYAFSGLGKTVISVAGAASAPPLLISGTWFGGTGTNSWPAILAQPAGTTTTTWSASGTGIGVNAASGFTGRLIDLKLNGTSNLFSDQNGNLNAGSFVVPNILNFGGLTNSLIIAGQNADSPIAWTNGNVSATRTTFIGQPVGATATLQLGATNAASPVNQTLQVQGSRAGTDSNVAGAKLSINPGAGTGNAAPNPLQLNSYVAVASGSGVQTLTNTLTLNSGLIQFNQYTAAGLLQNDASGNVTTNTAVVAATIPANFIAADRLTIVISGTTYYIPLATVAF